jgi:peptidoglycan hydrolase-like protein with peptidoglycan-binding domain
MPAVSARLSSSVLGGRRPLRMPLLLRSLPSLLLWLVPRSRDSIAGVIAGLAGLAILINALFMQSGPHPAPMFASKPAPLVSPAFGPVATLLPPRQIGDVKADAPVRPRTELVGDIQRELAKHGFYDGGSDGVYGPRTDAAIRDFEQAAGLRPSAEPNEGLLSAITHSSIKAAPVVASKNDPIADLLGPNKRLIAIQRALSDFGYGPVRATGVHDAQTKAAIERFERARRRPMTGNVSEQLVRELSAMTGRPLEW